MLAFPGCEQADIALVIDSSGSIQEAGNNWARMKTFLQELVSRLDIGPTRVRVGAVKFSGDAYVEFFLNTYSRKSDIKTALGDMTFLGTKTYTGLGLRYMRNEIFQRNNGDREGVPNIAIVVTDGRSNMNEHETKLEADLAKESGIRIIAVGITDQINQMELREIASDRESLITVDNFDILMEQLDNIISITCQKPTDEPIKGMFILIIKQSI